MQKPNALGISRLLDINHSEIIPFINWAFFFHAWKMAGKYDGIETICDYSSCKMAWLQRFPKNERNKAKEALKLYRNAQEILLWFSKEKTIRINAVFGLFPAHSTGNDVIIHSVGKKITIPTLRQQHLSNDGYCYSLADFLDTKNDYIGIFANTVLGAEEISKKFEQENDFYRAILVKTLADRLVEAASEWLHFQVRKKYWGYNSDEQPDTRLILKKQYPGIRPAVGYPSLPDQSVIFDLKSALKFEEIGINTTENGAMFPNSSMCGLYFSHPKSKYFMIGKIDENQLADYARRRGKTPDEMKKWLAFNI